jgi:phosphatidylserine/phosphatidylglycerophosphate/cardiolipin synthase-like enzyme
MAAPDAFSLAMERLIQLAPKTWLESVSEILKSLPARRRPDEVVADFPVTHNADLSALIGEVVDQAHDRMTWETLGWVIGTTASSYSRWQSEHHFELLWAGPMPANRIPARRIDQTLYDLIAAAKREILLVTFAAAKIERLSNELLQAARRGVSIRLILEFEQTSEGQLTYSALKAFPPALAANLQIYCWPVEKRGRNQAGRPGKLHAKLALVDKHIIVSSANLTDDAFNRNLELGVRIQNPDFLITVKTYFDALIAEGVICRVDRL